MLKAATLFLSFLIGRMNSSGHESLFSPEELVDKATDKIAAKFRAMMGQFALGAVGLTLLLAGALVAYFHVLDQWDVTDIIVIDAVFAGGLVMAVLGIILFGVAVKLPQKVKQAEQKAKEEIHKSRSSSVHPLEEAISAFIMDHIEEREFSREQRRYEMQSRMKNERSYRDDSSRKSDKGEAHIH